MKTKLFFFQKYYIDLHHRYVNQQQYGDRFPPHLIPKCNAIDICLQEGVHRGRGLLLY